MSDVANKGRGGKGPERPKKDSGGGFWSGLAEGFVSALSKGQPARHPADPVERMETVREDRAETGRELVFRSTEGAAGQAPMDRVDRQRRYVARAANSRAGNAGRGGRAPKATGSPPPPAAKK